MSEVVILAERGASGVPLAKLTKRRIQRLIKRFMLMKETAEANAPKGTKFTLELSVTLSISGEFILTVSGERGITISTECEGKA